MKDKYLNGIAAPPRVLVVDPNDLFRLGIKALLEREGFGVADACSGEEALSMMRTFVADVVLIDVKLRGMSGIETTQRLTASAPSLSVLMLTVDDREEAVLDAIRAGTSGYLLKDAQWPDIIAAIRAASAGYVPFDPRAAGALVMHVRAMAPCGATIAPKLSNRERAVLDLLAQGFDNGEIGARLDISKSTVKSHVSKVLEKLGVENRVQAAAYAVRAG
jgi:DNA-binding NarL/FixJ family response regulator